MKLSGMQFLSQPALQLLALCQLAAGSPCKPSSSDSSIVPTTTTIEPVESDSSTIVSETAASVSTLSAEPTTTLEATTDSTTGFGETTTIEVLTSLEATTTALSEVLTTSFTSTTVESTTTTSISQAPINLIVNGGFEDVTDRSSWKKVTPDGDLNVVSNLVHSGNKAGYFNGEAPSSVEASMGIKQDISASTLEAGKLYKLSAWYMLPQSGCFGLFLACGYGESTFALKTELTPYTITYHQAERTCSWTQDELNRGPNIQVVGDCFRVQFFLDDVVLEEVV
ncbi:hypothetical protein FAUST_12023 [Fusarium austroamericanum]|uniref:CBM-cenC domain-containing protein n=1 Tax=Fusarium austroamericanum TaxID=282268 RepID=A0AAN6BUI3_FUSAU|nr:hypothetical protein FAUST_12023 [Fusarium austroamericanum]